MRSSSSLVSSASLSSGMMKCCGFKSMGSRFLLRTFSAIFSIENVSENCCFHATVSYFTDSSSSVALIHWGSILVHSMTAMKVRLGGIVPFTSLASTLGTLTDQSLSTLISTPTAEGWQVGNQVNDKDKYFYSLNFAP